MHLPGISRCHQIFHIFLRSQSSRPFGNTASS
jgi:hypothetical protein